MDRQHRVENECRQALAAAHQHWGPQLRVLALFGSAAWNPHGEWHDLDFYAIVEATSREEVERPTYEALAACLDESCNVLTQTPGGFERDVTPLMLDLALDSVILYDTECYFADRLARLRRILLEAGLKRQDIGEGNFYWHFARPPRGNWAITWEGYRDQDSSA